MNNRQQLPGPPVPQNWLRISGNRMTRKFLSEKYDLLYDLAKQIIKDYNPCNIILCEIGHTGIPAIGCRAYGPQPRNNAVLCCGIFEFSDRSISDKNNVCTHLGSNGCKVKSLRCALWYCESCNYSNKMPHVHFNKDVVSQTPVLSPLHLALIKEMKHYRMDGVFRQGKVKTVESAYQSFKENPHGY